MKITLRTVLSMNEKQLKSLRDNTNAPYNVRRAADNLLKAKQTDGVRQQYIGRR